MKFNCAIVDDEQLARQLLEGFVAKISYLNLIGSYKSPLELVEPIQNGKLDLLFLDIQMPEITGYEFIKTLERKPAIIITTAYSKYAVEGYELDIKDYLLKPFSFNRFLQAVNKSIGNNSANEDSRIDGFIKVSSDRKTYKIDYQEINYIEGLKEYVSFFTNSGQRIISLMSLKSLEETLPQALFIRVHKSYIVRKDLIKVIEGNSIIINDKRIPIGSTYKEQVRQSIF